MAPISKEIDRELRHLAARCVKSGFTAKQVEAFAGSFFDAAAKARRERWMKAGIVLSLSLLMLAFILHFKYSQRLGAALLKAVMIKMLGVWDWTSAFHSRCLVVNPLYRERDLLTVDHCQVCEGVASIQHVPRVDPGAAVAQWFSRDVPFIVEDGARGLLESGVTTPQEVAQLYQEDSPLGWEPACGFSSNLATRHGGGRRDLLQDIVDKNISHYFAHWENCRKSAAKAFRGVFGRPYFLPPAVQTSSTNWVYLASNYTGAIFKRVEVDHPLVILLQVSGETEVQVKAWSPCGQLCPVLTDTLLAGQALVVTDFLWKMSYLPVPEKDSFAVGIGASF